MNKLSSINCEIVFLIPTALLEVIFYGDKMLYDKSNQWILTVIINYIKNTQRFEQALFWISEGNSSYQLTTSLFLDDSLTVYEETVRRITMYIIIIEKNILKNFNRSIFVQLNISSLRNELDSLVTIVNKNNDTLLILETGIDYNVLTAQFYTEGISST